MPLQARAIDAVEIEKIVRGVVAARDSDLVRAAGVLFMAGEKVLFLQRSRTGDHAGEWNFPGGGIEAGESAEAAARRECVEEIGFCPDVPLNEHCRKISTEDVNPGISEEVPHDGVDFTTFYARVPEEFTPRLNAEHTAFAWAPVGSPPEPLHPGCRIALAKFTMNELDIARAMAAGELTSPQKYYNLTLFLMRITGTGTAFRSAHNEFAYRKPEHYLTEDFLARCNGLPVIMDHSEGTFMSTAEYKERNVGSVMLPFIWGDEVWGVVRCNDHVAAETVLDGWAKGEFSTSPAVVFRNGAANSTLQVEGGETVLIEGIPDLIDHLAICERGVWDKGGDPSGIIVARGDSEMTVPVVRKDEGGAVPDKVLADAIKDAVSGAMSPIMDSVKECMDSVKALKGRMDAEEDERKDRAKKDAEEKEKKDAKAKKDADDEAERVAADKAKKDAEEKAEKEKKDAEEKERKDKEEAESKKDAALAAKDAENKALRERLDAMDKRIPLTLADEEVAPTAAAQSRADSVYMAHSMRAPARMSGEAFMAYRRRLLAPLLEHSVTYKDSDLTKVDDPTAFGAIEATVYADAATAARNPKNVPDGMLRMVTRKDDAGRSINEFYGDPLKWMAPHSTNRQFARFQPQNAHGTGRLQ